MIYLTTGANGSGKTLLTLKDVREQQLKENRPVYFHGFDMDPEVAKDFGWKEFDPKKWQDLPDGSICIMDECQNEFPLRRGGAEVPDYINAVAQHRRRRGFDFWMICPHPSLLDTFIRRLIDKPSWHRHLKRAFGANVVSVLTFGSPDMTCEKPGAGSRGTVTMRPFPKDVYKWYNSAQLHTGKRKIPRAVYFLAAAVVIVPIAFYFGFASVYKNVTKDKSGPQETPTSIVAPSALAAAPVAPGRVTAVSADDYLAARKPRLPDFPHTAPIYDDVTKPVVAPYPAACIQMGKVCKCYTQQATIMQVSGAVCVQIVNNGYFVEWRQEHPPERREVRATERPAPPPAQSQQQPQIVVLQQPQQTRQQPHLSSWEQGLAARNAQVRSSLGR